MNLARYCPNSNLLILIYEAGVTCGDPRPSGLNFLVVYHGRISGMAFRQHEVFERKASNHADLAKLFCRPGGVASWHDNKVRSAGAGAGARFARSC
jgi:hypothetical protein